MREDCNKIHLVPTSNRNNDQNISHFYEHDSKPCAVVNERQSRISSNRSTQIQSIDSDNASVFTVMAPIELDRINVSEESSMQVCDRLILTIEKAICMLCDNFGLRKTPKQRDWLMYEAVTSVESDFRMFTCSWCSDVDAIEPWLRFRRLSISR